MKKIIIAFLFLGFIGMANMAKADSIKWITMDEAIALNKIKPKKIFIDVYTSWCGWCVRMDTSTFSNPSVIRYMNQNFYCVKFNAEGQEIVNFGGKTYDNPKKPKRSTHPFAAILLNGQMTYPSFVVLDEKMRGVSLIKGYKNVAKFYPMMKFFATEAYKQETLEAYLVRTKQ